MADEESQEMFSAKGGTAVVVGQRLEPMARALYIGGAGNVTVQGPDGSVVTYVNVQAGFALPVQAIRVTAATATDIVAMH